MSNDGAVSGLTETTAYARAEQHLRDAVRGMDADVELRPGLRNAVPVELEGRPDAELPALSNVEVAYIVDLPEPEGDVFERNRALFDRLEQRWSEQGYQSMNRTESGPFAAMRVVDPDDGFVVSLKQGKIGNLWITASSPPVPATDVTPPPPALALTPPPLPPNRR